MQVTDEMVEAALHEYVVGDHDTPEQAMRAALTAALAKAWRPIEEYEGEDRPVLLWTGDSGWPCGVARWRADNVVPFWEGLDGESYIPTHWMPLPTPPATKEAGER